MDSAADPRRHRTDQERRRVHAALGSETDNFFIAAFLLVGMVVVLAVVTAVLVVAVAAAPRSGDVRGAGHRFGCGVRCGRGRGCVDRAVALRRHRPRRCTGFARAPGGLCDRGTARVLCALGVGDRGIGVVPAQRWRRWSMRSSRCRRHATISAAGLRRKNRCCGRPSQWTTLYRPPRDDLCRNPHQPRHPHIGHRVQQRRPFRPNHVLAQRLSANRSVNQRSAIGADIGCSSMCSLNMSRW